MRRESARKGTTGGAKGGAKILEPSGKSARKSVLGKPFEAGEDLRRGHGPTKGAPNAGRPPDAWRLECRELASREDVLDRARAILADPSHPAWLGVWRFVTEQGYGKAAQRLEVAGDAAQPLEIIIRREV